MPSNLARRKACSPRSAAVRRRIAVARASWERLLSFRCTGCGNCCRDTVVMLTDTDVRRIVDGAGLAVPAFVRFVAGDDIRLERSSPWWVKLADRRAVMALRWRRGHCTFLGADDRCGIYEHRPVTCRSHPFNVTLSDTGAVEHVSLSRVVHCEYELDGRVTRRSLIAVDRWNDRDSGAYQTKVARWNRRRDGDRSERAFLEYLGLPALAPA